MAPHRARELAGLVDLDRERRARDATFARLEALTLRYGDVIPWKVLQAGFEFEGQRVPWITQRGIFIPAVLELPISITTSPNNPYGDEMPADGFLHYRYFQDDPLHRDNVGLRRCKETGTPLVYFHAVESGWYQPLWPAVIHHDDPPTRTFTVALEDPQALRPDLDAEAVEVVRSYVTTRGLRRVHQAKFRRLVLRAYANTCAVCRLQPQERFRDLLDAAHIRPDAAGGAASVPNGLALCKIHHTAYDVHVVGIRPDYVVEINADVLDQVDGPMLRHGLQERHGEHLHLPRRGVDRPDPALLEERYEAFRAAG